MTDDAKQAAWRRFCERLETLEVDPYSPKVPEDDPRHEQVQAIIAEYHGTPQPLFPLPESWEGASPLFTITSLEDVSRWIRDEWSMVTSSRLGSEDGFFQAKNRATQTIRNTHRILDTLKIEDRPERQAPAESLEDCEQQFQHLEQWFREKHTSGWIPLKTPTLAAKPRANRKKRSEIPDDYEANIRVRKFLDTNPRAGIRQVSEAIELSTGKISKLEAWQLEMAKRKSERPMATKEHQQLTEKMLAAVGNHDDPAATVIQDEAIWQWVLEQAPPKQRAELHMKSSVEKAEVIELSREAYENQQFDPDD
jgi:hypothetical protein